MLGNTKMENRWSFFLISSKLKLSLRTDQKFIEIFLLYLLKGRNRKNRPTEERRPQTKAWKSGLSALLLLLCVKCQTAGLAA